MSSVFLVQRTHSLHIQKSMVNFMIEAIARQISPSYRYLVVVMDAHSVP